MYNVLCIPLPIFYVEENFTDVFYFARWSGRFSRFLYFFKPKSYATSWL